MEIENALKAVLDQISSSAAKTGKDPSRIKLVTVSKTVALAQVIEAVNAGASILGENRVQEAKEKITNYELRIKNPEVEWHLIGNLQKNKAKTAVELFDLIHSVDSQELAEELNKYASKKGKIQRILVQVKLSEEETKHGVLKNDLTGLLEKIAELKNLRFEGLMTIPPYFNDVEKTRPYFRKLKELAEDAEKNGFKVNELSMGMSNDFETAIEEGATMVRVGTAIFGERDYG